MNKRLGLTFIILCSLIWAVNPLIFKFILSHVSPFTLVGLTRLSSAVTILVIALVIDRKHLVQSIRGFKLMTLLGGIFLGVHFLLFMTGLDLSTAVSAQILIQTEAVYFVIWGFIFFHERVTVKKLVGIALAVIGVFAVSWNGQDLSVLLDSRYFAGNMIVLLGAVLLSVYMAFQKGLSDRGTGFPTLFPIFLIASVITLPLVPREELIGLDPFISIILCLSGVFIAVSFLFFAKSLEHILSSTISVILLASPILTIAIVLVGGTLDIPFFLGEKVTAYILLGGAAILFGAFLVISEQD